MFGRFFRQSQKLGKFEFRCPDCGELHSGSPSFAYAKPSYFFDVPEEQREARIQLSDDLCRISPAADEEGGETFYFIRVTLDVPIHGAEDPFCWGVWVSQSEESFNRYVASFSEDQSEDGSFGWLTVTIPHYNRRQSGEVFESLACDVKWGGSGRRPKAILHETSHPLYEDQANGISWETAVQIARSMLHPDQ